GMLGGGAVVPAAVLALGRDIDAGVALLADVGVVGLARRTGPRHAPPRVRIHVVHVRAGGIVARRRHDDGRLPRLGVVSHLLDPRRGRLTGLDPGAGRTVTVGGHQLRGVLAGQGRAARLERGPHRLGHLRLPLRIEVRRHLHVEGPSPLRDPHRGHGGLAVGAGVLDRHLERPRLVPGARLDLAGEPPHGRRRGHRQGIVVTRVGPPVRPPVLAPHGRRPPGRIRQTGGTVPPRGRGLDRPVGIDRPGLRNRDVGLAARDGPELAPVALLPGIALADLPALAHDASSSVPLISPGEVGGSCACAHSKASIATCICAANPRAPAVMASSGSRGEATVVTASIKPYRGSTSTTTYPSSTASDTIGVARARIEPGGNGETPAAVATVAATSSSGTARNSTAARTPSSLRVEIRRAAYARSSSTSRVRNPIAPSPGGTSTSRSGPGRRMRT